MKHRTEKEAKDVLIFFIEATEKKEQHICVIISAPDCHPFDNRVGVEPGGPKTEELTDEKTKS